MAETSKIPFGDKAMRAVFLVLPVFYFLYIFFLSLGPLDDFDLWWHLRTGQWIWENRSLPAENDPFSYTSPSPLAETVVRGMRSQWLGQVLYWLSYLTGGLAGVSFLRSFLLVAPFALIYIKFVREGAKPFSAISAILLPSLMSSAAFATAFERPQAFSFLLSLITVLILEALRKGEAGLLLRLALPLTMALWANIHGGFIIGIMIILFYMAGEAAVMVGGKAKFREKKIFYISCAAGIASTMLNPNAHHLSFGLIYDFLENLVSPPTLETQYVPSQMMEFKSLWFLYRNLYITWPLYIWAFTALCLTALAADSLREKRIDASRLIAFASVGLLSAFYSRITLFALILMPVLAGSRAFSRRVFQALFIISALIFILSNTEDLTPSSRQLRDSLPERYISQRFPEKAVRFIKENNIEGPMFNFLPWGGFIMWSAYPQYRVFVDGRSVDEQVTVYNSHIITVASPGWQSLLDAYGVNFVVMPVVMREIPLASPLVMTLASEEAWRLVYLEENASVFVRATERNKHITEKYRVPKEAIYRDMLKTSEAMLKRNPENPRVLFIKTIALLNLSRHKEAMEAALTTKKAAYKKGGIASKEILAVLKSMGY